MITQVEPAFVPETPKSVRLPKSWPHAVEAGDVSVKIYRNKGNVRGQNFTSFAVSYYANGKRQLRRFTDFGKAKSAAEKIAGQKAQGSLGAAALTAEVRISFESALTLLAQTEGTGNATAPRLVEIVRDYATARAGLPKDVTLAEAAQFYKAKHPANQLRKIVAEVVAEFIADRQSAGCSMVHVHILEVRLGQFSKAFALPMNSVSAPLVQHRVYGAKNLKTGKPTGPRTKENMLLHFTAWRSTLKTQLPDPHANDH